MSSETAVIIAPYFGHSGHVGAFRVERFVRWLAAAGVRVVVVRGGSNDRAEATAWGMQVSVRDLLGLYRDGATRADGTPSRAPNALRRRTAHALLVPEPSIAWSLRASVHPMVRRAGRGARWVISSSPPESVHLAAARIAAASGAELVVDMRDGWLDEPLRTAISRPGPRRLLEGALERRVLERAAHVFVTSHVWRSLLVARYPRLASVTSVLTNGYPAATRTRGPRPGPATGAAAAREGGGLELLHAGRFSGTHVERTVDRLLAVLLQGVARSSASGRVTLLGHLDAGDLARVEAWRPRLAAAGWALRAVESVPRAALLERYREVDGLLLLSASRAAIPSKLFEYLPTRRPILSVTPEGSAVHQLSAGLPQVFTAWATDGGECATVVTRFLEACGSPDAPAVVPPEFSDEALRRTFLEALRVPDRATR